MAHRNPRIRLFEHGSSGDLSYSPALIFLRGSISVGNPCAHPPRGTTSTIGPLPASAGGPTLVTGRFRYDGRCGVSSFCHHIQEFLCLLLAVNARKNFGVDIKVSFALVRRTFRSNSHRPSIISCVTSSLRFHAKLLHSERRYSCDLRMVR